MDNFNFLSELSTFLLCRLCHFAPSAWVILNQVLGLFCTTYKKNKKKRKKRENATRLPESYPHYKKFDKRHKKK